MEINNNLVEVLNDLIEINNDRIKGYEKAQNEARDQDLDLKAVFGRMMKESRLFISDLSQEMYKLKVDPTKSKSTLSGKIYRAWMDIKSAMTSNDRLTILETCEFGEEAAQKAYQQALVSDETISIDIRHLIASQKKSLEESHDIIKRYKDMHKKAASDDIVSSNKLRNSENDLRNEKQVVSVD